MTTGAARRPLAHVSDVAERLAALRERRGAHAWQRCEAVRSLIVVCSSSRGGSTLFGELLRNVPDLIHTSAEINPHVVIPILDGFSADLVADPSPVEDNGPGLRVLQAELGLDLGRPGTGAAGSDRVAWRLTMQWPTEPIDPDVVRHWVAEARAEVGDASRELTFLAVLKRACCRHPSINPLAYDVDPNLVRSRFPEQKPPSPPPAIPVVEMAPFIIPRAWESATVMELMDTPVVVVTPRNALRLPLLQAAFPNADVRVIHLVRNPAAAINGLIDGWHHEGFFSTPVDVPLSISGYSDRHPGWGGRWWCFDLPPGWRDKTSASLPAVCAFQWAASHRATIESASRMGLDYHRIHFEDLVSSSTSRRRVLARLARWLRIGEESLTTAGERSLPVVMSTSPPRPGRWRDRRNELEPVLADERLHALAAELGYSQRAAWS